MPSSLSSPNNSVVSFFGSQKKQRKQLEQQPRRVSISSLKKSTKLLTSAKKNIKKKFKKKYSSISNSINNINIRINTNEDDEEENENHFGSLKYKHKCASSTDDDEDQEISISGNSDEVETVTVISTAKESNSTKHEQIEVLAQADKATREPKSKTTDIPYLIGYRKSSHSDIGNSTNNDKKTPMKMVDVSLRHKNNTGNANAYSPYSILTVSPLPCDASIVSGLTESTEFDVCKMTARGRGGIEKSLSVASVSSTSSSATEKMEQFLKTETESIRRLLIYDDNGSDKERESVTDDAKRNSTANKTKAWSRAMINILNKKRGGENDDNDDDQQSSCATTKSVADYSIRIAEDAEKAAKEMERIVTEEFSDGSRSNLNINMDVDNVPTDAGSSNADASQIVFQGIPMTVTTSFNPATTIVNNNNIPEDDEGAFHTISPTADSLQLAMSSTDFGSAIHPSSATYDTKSTSTLHNVSKTLNNINDTPVTNTDPLLSSTQSTVSTSSYLNGSSLPRKYGALNGTKHSSTVYKIINGRSIRKSKDTAVVKDNMIVRFLKIFLNKASISLLLFTLFSVLHCQMTNNNNCYGTSILLQTLKDSAFGLKSMASVHVVPVIDKYTKQMLGEEGTMMVLSAYNETTTTIKEITDTVVYQINDSLIDPLLKSSYNNGQMFKIANTVIRTTKSFVPTTANANEYRERITILSTSMMNATLPMLIKNGNEYRKIVVGTMMNAKWEWLKDAVNDYSIFVKTMVKTIVIPRIGDGMVTILHLIEYGKKGVSPFLRDALSYKQKREQENEKQQQRRVAEEEERLQLQQIIEEEERRLQALRRIEEEEKMKLRTAMTAGGFAFVGGVVANIFWSFVGTVGA